MKRLALCLLVVAVTSLGCDKTSPTTESEPSPQGWSAQVAFLESTGEAEIEVRGPGAKAFTKFDGGAEIEAGSTIRTAPNTRARLVADGAQLVVNHSTTITLSDEAERTVELAEGQLVVWTNGPSKSPARVILPTGEAVLHGTKVSAVANDQISTISVAAGMVAVSHDGQTIEARAGDEIVLPREGRPTVHTAPELGQEFGWSELVDPKDEARIEVPRGLGKLVGKAPGGERERPLDLVEHAVETNIQGNLAYTEVTERFRNPTGEMLEGVYRFPLPADAQISRLALEVNGKLMEGEFLETERAEQIWRDVIQQSLDPAMLKWKQGNQFELRIFPIQPREIRRVIIGYTQRLEPAAGGYRYVYPMPVDHAGTIPAERFTFAANVEGHDPTGIFQVGGYHAKVEHRGTADDSARTEVRWAQDDFVAAGDLSVRYTTPFDENGFEAFRYDSKREDRGFFSMAIRPEFPRSDEIAARDVLIAIDHSYHQKGQALALQKSVAKAMLDEVDPLDAVSVMACNTRCVPLGTSGFGPVTPDRETELARQIDALEAHGASNPVEVARVASGVFTARGATSREARLVWFTDGIASAGELRPGKLRDAMARVAAAQPMRVTLVGVGGDTDAANLAAMTEGLGAVETELDPAMTVTGHALNVMSTLYGDLLTGVSIELPDGAEAVYPRGYRTLAPGDELVVTGRVKGALKGDVTVKGVLRGEPWSATYPVSLEAGSGANSFLPRMWASARIRDLELAESGEKDAIIDLSKRYGVLSRYTTLLALESEEMMRDYGVQKRRYDSWDGEAAAEDSDMEMAEAGAAAPAPDARKGKSAGSRATKRTPKPEMKRAPSTKTMDMPGLDSLGSIGSEPVAKRRRSSGRRYAMPRRRRVSSVQLVTAETSPTSWERSNIERKSKRLAAEPGNRTRTMQLIRALHRAGELDEARRRIDAWLATNDRDPEALVQLAQWHSLRGELDQALTQLTNGVDVAPRGEWIQERVHRAHLASGNEALACAHGVALRGLQKRPEYDQDDVLACPMATDMKSFASSDAAPDAAPDEAVEAADRKAEIEAEMKRLGVAAPAPKEAPKLRGDLRVVAKWEGGADVDILVVEPDGRVLSWLSQRRRIEVRDVRSTVSESLALPSMRSNGTYRIIATRRSGEGPIAGNLEVTSKGTTKEFPFVIAAGAETARVAETEWKWSWR